VRKYVTNTGRALHNGRTTRATLTVKRPAAKPLPFHLQCHPQALSRTKRHPGCNTNLRPREGEFSREPFLSPAYGAGKWLSAEPGPVSVEVVGRGTWFAPSLPYAMAWKDAAEAVGPWEVNVYLNELRR